MVTPKGHGASIAIDFPAAVSEKPLEIESNPQDST